MSETLLAIDPGIRGAGVALFNGAELVVARYVKNACPVKAPMAQRISCLGEEIGHMQPPRVLVTECPQIYIFGKGKGNPNDLVPLAQLGAFVAARFCSSDWVQYLPREWKGTLDADMMTARIKARLTADELARVESYGRKGALDHNTLDACGLGLHHVGRLTPRKIFAR